MAHAANHVFVLRDQDNDDCRALKQRLVSLVQSTGRGAVVRIVCKALESWILGDLEALGSAYNKRIGHRQNERKYRDPDALGNPHEVVTKLVEEYTKVDGAKRVGRITRLTDNCSRSFQVFAAAVRASAVTAPETAQP